MHGAPPMELSDGMVCDAVARGWAVNATTIQYLAVGGGDYHWRLTEASGDSLFVTVHDLDTKDWFGLDRIDVAVGLDVALSTARWLHHEAGLGFVVAPLTAHDGQVMQPLSDRFAVSVCPYLEGLSHPFGPHTDPVRRRHVLDALIALHTIAPPSGVPNYLRPHIGARPDLESFLEHPAEPWNAGPFGERARSLLVPHSDALVDRLDAFDRASRPLTSSAGVITHGEPHTANVLTVRARELLIDWDTVGLAVPERDLWLLAGDDSDLQYYAAATGHQPSQPRLALYRTRWLLDDIGHAVKTLRAPHFEDDDAGRNLAAVGPLMDKLMTTPPPQP